MSPSQRGLRFHRSEGTWADDHPIVVQDYSSDEVPWMKRWWYYLANIPHLQSNKLTITVNVDRSYQRIIGFGGAVTGSVAYNLGRLPEEVEDHILQSYYSTETGIGYNMLRIAIGGSDFDLSPWSYNDWPKDDLALSSFTKLDARDLVIIKRIKKIKALVETGNGRKLKIKACAWGCPRWMRDPDKRRNGPGTLKPKYYQTWAEYHVRFLELMKAQGIDIWAMSPGNEPMNGLTGWFIVQWMTLGWRPVDVAKYIVENLGPTLRDSPFNQTLILAGDDQRLTLPWYFEQMRDAEPKVFDYIDGLAVHSYFDTEFPPEIMAMTQERFPDKFIITTEGSVGDIRYNPRGPDLGSWDRGVLYINMYMQNFRISTVGWIDWNLALDEQGGPNYVNNNVDSPIIVNATAGEAYKQPIFYAIGHFSKFIPENSVRVEVQSDWAEVETIGFLRPDNGTTVIIHNHGFNTVEISLEDVKRGTKQLQLPPYSITTVVYQALPE